MLTGTDEGLKRRREHTERSTQISHLIQYGLMDIGKHMGFLVSRPLPSPFLVFPDIPRAGQKWPPMSQTGNS